MDEVEVTLLVAQELEDPAIPCSDVCEEFLQAFDAAVREGFDPFLGAVIKPDHLAVIDVVGIGGDDFDEFEVFADPLGDFADGLDMRDTTHQAASADRSSGCFQFHGSNSGRRETGRSEIRAMTSASQACGSTPFSLAVSQWDQAMVDADQEALDNQKKAGDSAMAQLLANEQGQMNAIKAAGVADMKRLTSEHQAFMSQMNAQAATRNGNFANYGAAKGLNTWNCMAHEVRGGALYCNTTTGKIFEVDLWGGAFPFKCPQ